MQLFSGPGVKTGLNIMMDNPGQLGADQVADAVAGIAGYPVPLILIDMGTATTASVVNSKKQYVGGMILPGVGGFPGCTYCEGFPAQRNQY